MTAVELAIYAAETKLLIKVVVALAAIFFAAALLFAFFYGTVRPRLRAAKGRNIRLRHENTTLRASNQKLKADLADGASRITALEKDAATLHKEVQRLNGIRKRTDSSLIETKALLERLQNVTEHVDMLEGQARCDDAARLDDAARPGDPVRPDAAASNDESARPALPDRSARRQRPT